MHDMTVRFSVDENGYRPVRSYHADGGSDICSAEDVHIRPGRSAKVRTGLHVEIPDGFAGLLVSKSGLNVNHAVSTTGLIDSGYTGEILVRVYNDGDEDMHISRGQRFTQIVIVPVLCPVWVEGTVTGSRGDNGFGSTGDF